MEQLIGQAGPAQDVVKDTDTQSFTADVIEASQTQPVVVDFWAPWCGPCKTLGPMLEQAVRAANGRVRMVKINIDENQQLAAQLRIQSIPTVYAFFQGRPVDAFQGAVPESQIKEFVSKLSGLKGQDEKEMIDQALEQAEELMTNGEAEQALAVFGQLLQHDNSLPAAIAGAARALIALGQTDQAQSLLDGAPEEAAKDPAIVAVRRQMELAQATEGATSEIGELERKVEATPDDHQARIDLAMAYYAADQADEATDALIDSIRRDKEWNEAAARTKLLELFEAWGPAD
ncbi:MAG: thioredoxin, partial [Pseudomonadota bacterium]